MARIRTIKPEFFRHEELYEAEKKSALPLRVAFAGLFTVADREGRFKWKPKVIKFDVLPYDDVDMETVLNALWEYDFIRKYNIDGNEYGVIPSFKNHQVINNREAKSTIPEDSTWNHVEKDASFTRGHACKGEGKGRKGKEGNTHVCVAIAEIFGRDWEEPENRMPALAGWFKTIEAQAEKICKVYSPDVATKQVNAYIRYCKSNDRKLIGTPLKVSETILQADWIALNTPEPVPRGDPYAEARYNKTLWTEDAWYEFYRKQIKTDPGFRQAFQITQT